MPHNKDHIIYSDFQQGDPNVSDGIYTLPSGATFEVKGGAWKWMEDKTPQPTFANQMSSNQTQFFANAPQSTESYLYGQRPDAKVINQYDTDLIQESRYNPTDFKPKTVLPKTQEQKLAEAEAQAQETAYKQMQTIGAANVQSDTRQQNYLAEIEQAKAYNTQQEAMMTEEYWKQALSPEDFAFLKEQLAYSQALDPNKTIKEVGEEFLAKKSTDFTNRFSQGALSEEEINALPIELRNDYYQGVIDDKTLEAARKANPTQFLPSGRAGWVSVEPYLIGGMWGTKMLGAAVPALGRAVGITSGNQLMNTSIPNYLGLSGTGATGVALEQLTLNNALNAIGAGMIPGLTGEAVENFQEGDYLEGFGNAAFATLNALPFIGPTAKGVKTLSTKISEFGNTKYNNLDEILTNVSKKGNIQFEKDINGLYNIKTKNANGEWETMPELVALEREMSAIPGQQTGLSFRAGEIEEIINLAKKNPAEFKQWMATNPDISSYPISTQNAIKNFVNKLRNVVPEVEAAQKGLKGDYIPMTRVDELNRRINSTLSIDLNTTSSNPMRSGSLTTGSFLETYNSIIRALEGSKSTNTISIHRLNDLSTEAAFGSTQGMRDAASAKFDDLLSNMRTGISNILKDRPDLFTDKNLQGLLNAIKIHNKTATKGKAIEIPWSSLAQNGTITPKQYLGEMLSETATQIKKDASNVTDAFDYVVGRHITKAFQKLNNLNLDLKIPKIKLQGLSAKDNIWQSDQMVGWEKTIDDMNASIANIEIPGKGKTDIGIHFYTDKNSPGTLKIRINPDKAIDLLPEAVREEVRKSFEVFKKQRGTTQVNGEDFIDLGVINFKLPKSGGISKLTFSDILKGSLRPSHEFQIPKYGGDANWVGASTSKKAPIAKGGDWPYSRVKGIHEPELIPFRRFMLGEEFQGYQFPGHQISGRTSKALGQSLKKSDAMLTSGGTGHTDEGTLRYISGLLDLGGTDQFTIMGSSKASKFQDIVNRIAKSPKEKAELQEQIKKIKAAWKEGKKLWNIPEVNQGLYKELANEIQSVTFGIKKYGGSLNTNQYGLGSYMAPQDLDPQTMQKYLTKLRELENDGKTGFKGGKWYPHESVEGGMPTVGYGHKVMRGEDFSKGLTEQEALALQEEDVLKHQAIAKKRIDEKFGKGTFDSLPQDSQMLAVDYEYNGVLGEFPSFTKALVENDKEGMLKEYVRYAQGKRLGTRNTWTKGVIEELEFGNGGSFNNSGFKSLPLQVQQQIMKGANKKELGGADTVDPTEVARLMKTWANSGRAGFDKTKSEQIYYPGSPEYQQALQAEHQRILSLNPTDHYLSAEDGRDYSAENVYAAMMANPPAYYYNVDNSIGIPSAMYDTPPSISNVTLQQMPTPPVQTVAPKEYKVLGSYGQELPWIEEYGVQGMHPYKYDSPLTADFQFSQYINEKIYKDELEARSFLTENELAKAREEGLTARQYTKKYGIKKEDKGEDKDNSIEVFKDEQGKITGISGFKYGGNIFAGGGMMSNKYAMGAQMPQGQMTDIPVTEFNAGGSHEANAMGGVYQGMASNGKPNLVEQGELKITIPGTDEQFIVSPKIKLDKVTAEEFGLSKKHVGKDMVKIFKSLLRKNNFAEREGDSIVENSKQLEIMPYVAAHQKLTEIANAKDQAKKQEAFDKDMTQMMEKHPEYMEALLAQSQQPMQQQGPSPEEMAMMEQQGAMQGGMPPMMANGGNMYKAGGWEIADKALSTVGTAIGSIPLGWTNAVGAAVSGLGAAAGQIGEQKDLYESTGERMGFSDIDWGAVGIDAAGGAVSGVGGAFTDLATNTATNVAQEAYKSTAELEAEKFQQMLANNPNSPEAQQRLADAEKYTGKEVNPYAEMGANVGMLALEKGAQMGAEKITENLAENALETGIGMIARYGGKQYKCGGKMHTYGGNMFALGSTMDQDPPKKVPLAPPPSGPIITEGVIPIEEDLNLLAENPYISDDAKRKYLQDEIMDTSLEEGIKDVTIEGGYLSALKAAPLITSGIMAFSPSESYSAGDLGYKATTAPKINYGQARRDIQQQAAGAAKDLRGAGPTGYKSNRIVSQQAANQALANISMQEENINKQMSYQNALQNAGRYQQAAAQAAIMTSQSEAAKAKALQDFGITVGSLGSGIARDYMEAGMANMYSPDIDLNYRMFGNSFLGGIKTNKDRAAKSEKKSKRKSNV